MSQPTRPRQWLSADHQADTPAFRRLIEREFPAVTDLCTGPDRRQFLRLMAASLSMAGLAGCDDETDGRAQEVPYVHNPLRIQPGTRAEYSTMSLLDGVANGMVAITRNARPTKIEGNPDHPWSRGGTDIWAQASVLDLYDPLRSQTVRYLDKPASWQAFRGQIAGKWAELRDRNGQGLHVLTGPLTSPSFLAQLQGMLTAMPKAVWYTHSATGGAHRYAGSVAAFGKPLETRYRFGAARVIVSFEGDFLDGGPDQIGQALDWVAARQASAAGMPDNDVRRPLLALYAAAAVPNLTAAKADHPLVTTPAEMLALAAGLLADVEPGATPSVGDNPIDRWRAAVAAALRQNRGASLVIAGATASPALASAVHRLNQALGNTGKTVFHTEPVVSNGQDVAALATAIHAGTVDTLLMLDTNPAYSAPGSLDFHGALERVELRIHAGQYVDETALQSHWHLPLLHTLEAWHDARAADGTITFAQPAIAPLYEGRTAGEILSLLNDDAPRKALDILRSHYQGDADDAAFAPRWETMLRDGCVPETALPPVDAPLAPGSPAPPAPPGLVVVIRPDPTLYAGDNANNAWLQELPKPLTKLVWDNVLTVSPALAAREGFANGDIASLEVAGRHVEGPIWVLPGQADHTVGATLGYGRRTPGLLCDGVGYNATVLRDDGDPWLLTGAVLGKTGRTAQLASTQDHDTMEGHDFIRVQHEGAAPVGETKSWHQPSLYGEGRKEIGPQWGMVIDLDACIGCNACVVACQSENNIAVVGKEQVALGREMHWLRVDRYYEGSAEAPQTRFQPVPCMHCENAPCEVGCPVEATLHDSEGLNLMVYNRCVGTRACSGYCPYKVRHFNYLDYSAGAAPTIELMRNPEVTVRARGVMEKCTYCVQRIETARIEAHKANVPIPDGAVQTACQGACPTRAISFGNLGDAASAVSAARADGRNYALLGELNTKPRTSYLAARAARPALPGETG
ncbi:MAG: TAT-variant-translocated molybdopterin oxidoreductase [Acetobacteraceae bacterium]|nr:TAT-variant-translocated molybdopterin oxidoreductase [Acetobacteraceae bacterium]